MRIRKQVKLKNLKKNTGRNQVPVPAKKPEGSINQPPCMNQALHCSCCFSSNIMNVPLWRGSWEGKESVSSIVKFLDKCKIFHESDTYLRDRKAGVLIHRSGKDTGYYRCLKTKIHEIFNRLGEEGAPLCPIQGLDIL